VNPDSFEAKDVEISIRGFFKRKEKRGRGLVSTSL
jgi:hypothetical protein